MLLSAGSTGSRTKSPERRPGRWHRGRDLKKVEHSDHVRRLGEHLLRLLDRANRMFVRNLKAIKELRQGPVLAVAIGKAEQVNVASQQVNTS